MVTDTGGVDDKSFNQSAWKGIKHLVKKMALKKAMVDMITYNQNLMLNISQT